LAVTDFFIVVSGAIQLRLDFVKWLVQTIESKRHDALTASVLTSIWSLIYNNGESCTYSKVDDVMEPGSKPYHNLAWYGLYCGFQSYTISQQWFF